jgi:hypothetical protein
LAVTLIQWFFIGFLFHKYQALTPSTWRKETGRSYAASTILAFFFAFMFAFIFSLWARTYGPLQLVNGIEFGAVCWLTFSVPAEVGNAIYVNSSPAHVVGKCLSSLFEFTVSGVIASEMIQVSTF